MNSTIARELRRFIHVKGSRNNALRAKARRGYLAFLHGGQCKYCNKEVEDFWNFGLKAPQEQRFEFDHKYPLDFREFAISPETGIEQFRISGNNVSHRSWQKVEEHCLKDTVLTCRECHYQRTMARKKWLDRAEGANMVEFYRSRGLEIPEVIREKLQL